MDTSNFKRLAKAWTNLKYLCLKNIGDICVLIGILCLNIASFSLHRIFGWAMLGVLMILVGLITNHHDKRGDES